MPILVVRCGWHDGLDGRDDVWRRHVKSSTAALASGQRALVRFQLVWTKPGAEFARTR